MCRIPASPSFFVLVALCLIMPSMASAFGQASARPPGIGDHVPSYASTKCGGIEDGVAVGRTVCYTCRAGSEPIFYVFAPQPDDSVVGLLKKIEAMVIARKDRKAAAVVNFQGDPANEATRQSIADFGKRHSLQHVTLTVTADGSRFGLRDGDAATVILFEDGIIRLRTAVPGGKLDDNAVQSIVSSANTVLK